MQRVRSFSGSRALVWVCLAGGILFLSLGALWYVSTEARAQNCSDCTWPSLQAAVALTPGTAAAMDSPVFTYSPRWTVTERGADPPEPADPFAAPAGTVAFTYTGGDLYLLLAPGDYWAYLYVTVDGRPANRLPSIPGNPDGEGRAAGYKPLLAPERPPAEDGGFLPRWQLVHHADENKPQNVLIEMWRGWGQAPLRGVGVDLTLGIRVEPTGSSLGQLSVPRWPPVLVMLGGVWLLVIGAGIWIAGRHAPRQRAPRQRAPSPQLASSAHSAAGGRGLAPAARLAPFAGGLGLLLLAASLAAGLWFLCPLGLALLALAGSVRPALWVGALLFGLPFAFGLKLPVLPSRSFDLIDIGVWGGVAILGAHFAVRTLGLLPAPPQDAATARPLSGISAAVLAALAAVVAWALVAAVGAFYPDLALREWRVVFLNALVFAGVLALTLRWSPTPGADRRLLVAAWLVGGAAVSLFGLWGYVVNNAWVSQAEGVRRIQAFYGSANNLALYLDRTLAVSLALALFVRDGRRQVLWGLLAVPQALAWLLTFSKGSLLLAAPAMALMLLVGGAWLLRQEGRSRRPLWILLGAAALGVLALTPFLGAERFQRLFDLGQGTGFLRLQLWRSALQMALDHPLLGVGPDNFLYAYRSGYMLPTAWQEPNLNHPHNLFLDWSVRLGLPGLLLGLTWLGLGVWSVVRWLQRGPEQPLALGVLAACAAGLAHGLIDVSYALPELMIVWVLLFGIRFQPPRGPAPTGAPAAALPPTAPLPHTQRSAPGSPTR